MAFRKINTRGEAIQIKKGTVVAGYLVGCRVVPSKKKGRKPSIIFLLRDKKTQADQEVWANGAMQFALMNEGRTSLIGSALGCMYRFTGGGKIKMDKGRNPMQETTIEMDSEDSIKIKDSGVKKYVLDGNKYFKK